jgi:hypothetical protein
MNHHKWTGIFRGISPSARRMNEAAKKQRIKEREEGEKKQIFKHVVDSCLDGKDPLNDAAYQNYEDRYLSEKYYVSSIPRGKSAACDGSIFSYDHFFDEDKIKARKDARIAAQKAKRDAENAAFDAAYDAAHPPSDDELEYDTGKKRKSRKSHKNRNSRKSKHNRKGKSRRNKSKRHNKK